MDYGASSLTDSSISIQWIWRSDPNPWSNSQTAEWSYYSDVENLIIEEAFVAKNTHAVLDDYCINFEHKMQIHNNNQKNQRPVERQIGKRDGKALRKSRFNFDPISPKRSYGGQYGWVSPFIWEARKDLKLEERQLPSQDETIVPMIVERAASGIIEEGKKDGNRCEAEWMARELLKQKDKGIKEVWKCCARLYSMASFLFKKLNETMRLIGSEEHENVWRSKIRSFGPFCLLLWDDPFKVKPNMGKTLYRAVNLSDTEIATYKECLQHPDEYRSFQAFTSCSRSRTLAEFFGTNVLFIIEVNCAFTSDLQPYSMMPVEEEELITPGVCFTVQQVEHTENTNKQLIYLKLQQRFNKSGTHEISNYRQQTSSNSFSAFGDHLRDADFSGIMGFLFNRRDNSRHLRFRDRDGLSHADPLSNLLPALNDRDDCDDMEQRGD